MDARFVSVPRTRGEAQTRNMTSNGPRRAIVAAIVGASGLVLCSAAAQPRLEPFVPVGVTYRVRSVAAAKQSAGDLQSIRAAGFNVIRTVVSWADAEDVRGEYNLAAMEALLRAGGDAGLRVVVQVDTRPAPGWVLQRYPSGRATMSVWTIRRCALMRSRSSRPSPRAPRGTRRGSRST
jgi:hypothetical protein